MVRENFLSDWSDIIHHMNSHDPLECKQCSKNCNSCKNQLENDIKNTEKHLEQLHQRLDTWLRRI